MKNFLKILINPSLEISSLPQNFDVYLFNQDDIIQQQKSSSYYTFVLLNTKKQVLEAKWIVFIEENGAFSPLLAPFGGLEFNPKISPSDLSSFIGFVEKFLKDKKVKSIYLKQYPFCYQQENNQVLTKILLDKNYQIAFTELNQHLEINAFEFSENLHLSEKRRLQRCKKAGFEFEEWQNPDLKFAYDFVVKARLRKNMPVSLGFEAFENLFKNFPEYYQIFIIKHQSEILALTTLIKISPKIVYYFFPADNENYLKFSPTVLLIEGLYNYAKNQQYKILDLGISTAKGELNIGLFQFKQNLGAKTSLKLSFGKAF